MSVPDASLKRRETMPGFDGTGPRGMGPMTDGGGGYCVIPLQELDVLKRQAQAMWEQLKRIEVRIRELEKPRAL